MESKVASRVLVLLDMNETLIYRKRERVKCGIPPNATGSKFLYLRPGYADLLYSLLSHPRAQVAVYSSMMTKNIEFVVDVMLKDKRLLPFKHAFTWFFGKKFNVRDPEGEKRTDTMRDLNLIWEDAACKGKYGPTNTVLIDNEARKVRSCPENAIVIDSFTASHLIERMPNNTYYMGELAQYMTGLLDGFSGDVRKQLKEKPFVVDQALYQTVDTAKSRKRATKDKQKVMYMKKTVQPKKSEEGEAAVSEKLKGMSLEDEKK